MSSAFSAVQLKFTTAVELEVHSTWVKTQCRHQRVESGLAKNFLYDYGVSGTQHYAKVYYRGTT